MTSNIYKQAIQVQDACNPRGVLHSFYTEIMPSIVAEVTERTGHPSTADICRHPAFVLFSNKLDSMAGTDFSTAYHIANERAAAKAEVD